MLRTKRLILTFDGFGTLFTPREPIAKSYADTARRHGLRGFTDDEIFSAFRDAFKWQSENAPNYGKSVGLNATQWWSNVIHSTFRPFTQSTALPCQLTSDLLNRFSSSEGYLLYPDVPPVFRDLREMKQFARESSTAMKISVGVVSNSDDRVPSVLSSLGLRVGSLRHGIGPDRVNPASDGVELSDIDFVILSYDVGFEKPSHEIFDAAKDLGRLGDVQSDLERYIHVGDDMDKDLEAARHAGWEGLLLDREGNHAPRKPGIADFSMSSLLGLLHRIHQEQKSPVPGNHAIDN